MCNIRSLLLLVLFFINVAIVLLACVILPVHFETVDDVYMCMIADGRYTGTPDPHLVYVSAVYGWILNFLYLHFTNIEWYTVGFLFLIIISYTSINYSIIKYYNISKYLKICFLLVLYLFELRFIQTLQFTCVAGVVCFSGCMLLYSNKGLKSVSWWSGVALIVIASMIRFEAAGLVGLLWFPIFVYTYTFEIKTWCKFIPLILFVLLLKYSDGLFYSEPKWQSFKQYNSLRSQIQDYPNKGNVNQNILNQDDYDLFIYFCTDTHIVNNVVLEQLVKLKSNDVSIGNIKQLMPFALVIAALVSYSIISIICMESKKDKLFVIFYNIVWLTLLVLISCFFNMQGRVFYLMVIPYLYTMFVLHVFFHGKSLYVAFILLSTVLFAKYSKQLISQRHGILQKKLEYTMYQLPMIENLPANSVVFPVPTTISLWYQYHDPLLYYKYPTTVCENSSLSCSPLQLKLVDKYIDLLKDNVYLLVYHKMHGNDWALNALRESIRRNYMVETELVELKSNERASLYKLLRK